MKLLSLDPSTTVLGWAVVEVEGFRIEHVGGGTFTPKRGEWWERIRQVEERVEVLWCDHGPVDAVAYEVPTGNRRNMKTNRRLGAVEYAVVTAAAYYTDKVIGVPASSVVNHDLGKQSPGHARKFAALVGREPTSDDECDALACAFVAMDKFWSEGGST